MRFYVSRTIRWYVTGEISFIRESIQDDEQTTATFRTTPEIMADVSAYDPKELLVILFNHVANFLSVGGGWRFDSLQSLAINLCPFRPTIGAGLTLNHLKGPKKGSVISKILKTIHVSYGAFSGIYIALLPIITPID